MPQGTFLFFPRASPEPYGKQGKKREGGDEDAENGVDRAHKEVDTQNIGQGIVKERARHLFGLKGEEKIVDIPPKCLHKRQFTPVKKGGEEYEERRKRQKREVEDEGIA